MDTSHVIDSFVSLMKIMLCAYVYLILTLLNTDQGQFYVTQVKCSNLYILENESFVQGKMQLSVTWLTTVFLPVPFSVPTEMVYKLLDIARTYWYVYGVVVFSKVFQESL